MFSCINQAKGYRYFTSLTGKFFALGLIIFSLFFSYCAVAETSLSASLLKAVYTYKFASFTRWPENKLTATQETFTLCILGRSPFSKAEIAIIENKQVKKRRLQIQIYKRGMISSIALQSCEIAFISESEKHRLPIILSELQGQAILTVSDIKDFSRQGGMITLVQKQQRIVFQVNNEQVESSGLQMSSKILELSEIVTSQNLHES